MTSQEKALKELLEINFVKMMDGVPVRSSIEMVKNKRSSKIFNRIDFQPQKMIVNVQLALNCCVRLNYFLKYAEKIE